MDGFKVTGGLRVEVYMRDVAAVCLHGVIVAFSHKHTATDVSVCVQWR